LSAALLSGPASSLPLQGEPSLASLAPASIKAASSDAAAIVPAALAVSGAATALENLSDWRNLAGFSMREPYPACSVYAEKEQSSDSNGTDVGL
jgi:hypothetical protein